ncbi:MAG: hypothetical protein K0Q72_980 [Armatimonadetes bacterium]|nr:hypothetical protein [Armatimonadota bacterium]
MPVFDHPLGLFSLAFSPEWAEDYDASAGSLTLRRSGVDGITALNLLPLAITGAPAEPEILLLEQAQRLGVWVPPEGIVIREQERLRTAAGEGRRPALGAGNPSTLRFWVFTRDALSVVITQLGPGTAHTDSRDAADEVVASLRLPEVVPPTPAEFLTSILKIIHQDFPQLTASILSEWEIEVVDADGAPVGRLGLADLYAEVLRSPAEAEALARQHLAGALLPGDDPAEPG